MTDTYIDLSTTDDAAAVDAAWLIALFEPGAAPPAQVDPDMQSLADVINALVQAWAHASSGARIPADKMPENQILPPVTAQDVGHVLKVAAGPVVEWASESAGSGQGLTAAQVDGRILAAIPLARRIPAFAVGDIGHTLQIESDGQGGAVLRFATERNDAETLEVRAAVPATAGFSTGDIINVGGDLYELIASGNATNVITGVAEAYTDPAYIGTPSVQWRTAGAGVNPLIVRLDQAALNSPPGRPDRIYVEFRADGGVVGEDVLVYDETHNTVQTGDVAPTYGYDGGSINFSEAKVGAKFSLTVYRSDAQGDKGALLRVHPHQERWELDSRTHVPAPADWAQAGQPEPVQKSDLNDAPALAAADLDTADAVLVDDASVGSGLQVRGVSFGALDTRWRTQRVPTGNTLPPHPHVGDRFRLLADDTVAHDPLVQGRQAQVTLTEYAFPNRAAAGPQALYGYTLGYGGTAHATLAGNVFLIYNGSMPADGQLIFYREGDDTRHAYDIADNFVPGLTHWYQVAGLSVGDIDDTGLRFHLNFESDGGANQTYPDITVEAGDLTYAGGTQGQAGWVPSPGIAAAWATQGQPDPRQILALTKLIDGPGAGLAVNVASAPVYGTFNAYVPDFDLDDADKQQGELATEAILTITSPGDASIGFNAADDTHPVTVLRKSSFAFASDVREADAYAQNATHGVQVATWPVYQTISGSRHQTGTVALYEARATGTNHLGYYWHWDPENVAGGSNFNLSSTLRADFTHNDRAGGAAGTARESHFTPSLAATAIATGTTGIGVGLAVKSGSPVAAGHGLSVAANRLRFARAGIYHIDFSLELEGVGAGAAGGGRLFVGLHWRRTRGAATTDLAETRASTYVRNTSDATGKVAPDQVHTAGNFAFLAQAGDELSLDLEGELVQPANATIQINAAGSEIAVISQT